MHRQLPTVEHAGTIDLGQLSAQQSQALTHFVRAQKISPGHKLPAQDYAFNAKDKDHKTIIYCFTLTTDLIYQGNFDPTSTDPQHDQIRQSFFQQVTPTRALPAGMQCIQQDGQWSLFQLQHGIYPRTQASGYYIVQDAADSALGKGVSGTVCDVLGKWQPTIDAPHQFNYTPSHDKRVIKILNPLKKGLRFNIGKEHQLMQCLPYFKVREIMRHEVGDSSTQYISQKKIRGTNFSEILKHTSPNAPRTATQKLSVGILLLRAMWRDMHLRQILHRDIKPANIIGNSDETLEYWYVKLVDLGCARRISETSMSFVGTPIYSAPEVCGNQEYSNQSDLYSAARVIGELFGDEDINIYRCNPPRDFDKSRANEHIVRFYFYSTYVHDLTSEQQESLIKLLQKMTHPTPTERYTDEEAIVALEAFRLEVVISKAHSSLHHALKLTHASATSLAKTLDIKSVEQDHRRRPLSELQADILQALEKIGASPQDLSLFKSIVAIKCLYSCKNKEDIHQQVIGVISNYEINYSELAEAITKLEAIYKQLQKQDVPEQAAKIERDIEKARLKLSSHANYQFDLDEIDEANHALRQSITKMNALIRYCQNSPALAPIDNTSYTMN